MSTRELADEDLVSITTFKRDSTPVSTPVCAPDVTAGGSHRYETVKTACADLTESPSLRHRGRYEDV